VTGSAFGNDRVVMIVSGVLHADGIEDLLLQHLLVRFSGDAFNDGAEQKVTGVVVGILRTGFKLEIAARVLLHELVNLVRVATHILEKSRLAGVTRNTRSVREQLMNRDLLPDVCSIVWQVIRDFRIELDFSLLDELHRQRRRELLRDRAEAK